jgi:hypothetical protein
MTAFAESKGNSKGRHPQPDDGLQVYWIEVDEYAGGKSFGGAVLGGRPW